MKPRIVVFSTLFPGPAQPNAGVFIRERMFRVGKKIPIVVVAPAPWFPLQGLIRRFRPHFRPEAPVYEEMMGVQVFRPRFLCIPGVFKFMDGLFMALGSFNLMRQLKTKFEFNVIDAHFAFPDGRAATILGRWLKVPVTITLRGTEVPHSKESVKKLFLQQALKRATHIFSVSNSLKKHVSGLGIDEGKIQVVGNGVDINRFYPVEQDIARKQYNIPQDAKVLITVGGLVERKGFHRVIEVLSELRKEFNNLHYMIVGSACAEGDWSERLKNQVQALGLNDCVHFLGSIAPDELKTPLSCADIFVLSTRNEGWANVLLEALACGKPVVATDVGGNAEVICKPELGTIVPFGDSQALQSALQHALQNRWNTREIIAYAQENSWDNRVEILEQAFNHIVDRESLASASH